MEKMKTYGCVERVTARIGELALVMDGHACDVAMTVGCLCQMPHLAMLAAVETMMIQMMPRCRKPMLSQTVTADPSVDPVTLSPMNMSRRQRRALKRRNPGNPKVARGHIVSRVSKVPLDPKAHQVPKVYQDPKVSQDPKVCNSFTVPHHSTGFPKEPALTASPARELLNSKGGSGKGKGYGGTGSDASSKHAGWRDAMLRDLHSMIAKNAEEKPWSIRKGPAPGLKYRGGTPPAPPQWTYNKGDLQAFNAGNAS